MALPPTWLWTAIHSALDPVKIKVTYNAAGRGKGDIVEHNFPSGGDFKVATAGEPASTAPPTSTNRS